jgi:HAMP domain-containing protein
MDAAIDQRIPTKDPCNDSAMWDPRRWPLGVKFGIALVLAALVPLALLANITLNAGRGAVEQAQLRTAQGAAIVSSAAVRQYLTGLAARADQVATRADVVRFTIKPTAEETPEFTGEFAADDVLAVVIYSPTGDPLLVESNIDSGLGERNVADERWFIDALFGRQTIGGLEINDQTAQLTAVVAAPIRFPGSGSVGVAAIQVRGSSVLYAQNQAPLVAGGQALLVSKDGVIQSARDSRVIGQTLTSFGAEGLNDGLTQSGEGSLGGVPWFGRGPQVAAWNSVNDDLTSVILQPQEAVLRPIEDLAQTTWLIFTVVAVLAFGLALVIARRLSRPISVLTGSAVEIEAGEPVDPLPLQKIGSARDDVGRLARVFSSMAEQVAQREQALREQVRALRVEINHERRQQAVSQVTDSDFFRDLVQRAQELRSRMQQDEESGP